MEEVVRKRVAAWVVESRVPSAREIQLMDSAKDKERKKVNRGT